MALALRAPRPAEGAAAEGGGAPVRRRRRAALVARAQRTRTALALLRRSALAALRRRALRRPPATPRCSTTPVPFIEGAAAAARRAGPLSAARISAQQASIFEHCIRAIDKGLTAGAHGLPLIGSGDWNDGLNQVGQAGHGESTWLGFFLYTVLTAFAPICEARGDRGRAERYRNEAGAAAEHARAELGRRMVPAWLLRRRHAARVEHRAPRARSTRSPQSWAVLSGAVPLQLAERAMDAVRDASGRPRIADDPAADAAVRSRRARSRLHQGLRAGHPRERRAVYPRRDLGGHGAPRASETATRLSSCFTCSTRSTGPGPRRRSNDTRPSPT